jgi:hypothetical protein
MASSAVSATHRRASVDLLLLLSRRNVVRHWRSAVIVGGATLLLACTRAGDTEEMVREALVQAAVGDVEVHQDSAGVRLIGTTETLANRSRAEELARAIVGSSVEVRNEITVTGLGPLRQRASDDSSSEGREP